MDEERYDWLWSVLKDLRDELRHRSRLLAGVLVGRHVEVKTHWVGQEQVDRFRGLVVSHKDECVRVRRADGEVFIVHISEVGEVLQ